MGDIISLDHKLYCQEVSGIDPSRNFRRAFAGPEELGLDIPQNPKIIVLKNLIESSEIFESDKEFLQSVIDGVLAEKAAKIEQEKFKLESEKAKIEFEKIKLEQLKKSLS
ncbi:hypothetical protein TNCV_2980291 [Trichonephila clavipes]|nr:hypothetical protein TNCV_2980291 [Trichonephila clavipes]